ncbi:MAG: DUF3253 domain-containing protein [Polyangiales bacterium]
MTSASRGPRGRVRAPDQVAGDQAVAPARSGASRAGKSRASRVAPARESSQVDAERYLVVDGRRWRRSDPSIPESLRQELVNALMAARRAVLAAKRAGAASDEKQARAQVQDAKVALGERGQPHWETPEDAAQRQRASATVRALLAARGKGKTICPSDVARVIGGEAWRTRMTLVRESALTLVERGELEVHQRGQRVDARNARGPIRYASPPTAPAHGQPTPPRQRRPQRHDT